MESETRASLRDVHWDGAVNARGFGGVAGLIVPGRLYRMGRREWLTARGWQHAWEDGVRTVIDLRSAGEVGRRSGDPDVPASATAGFSLRNLPTEDQSDAGFMAVCGPYLNSPRYTGTTSSGGRKNSPPSPAAVIDAPPGGIVVHCAAGRDRTGMVSALLLSACGVPAEDIADDYAVAVRAMNERYLTQPSPREKPRSEQELRVWLDSTRGHLLDLLSTLDAGEYLKAAGLGTAELAALTARLTGPEAVRA
jgi:hypothetical protein